MPSATVREETRKKFWPFRGVVPSETTKTQTVEIWTGNHKPKYLYSPITDSFGKNVETEAIACKTTAANLVRQGDSFHITVEGFYSTPHDFSFETGTEIFMYSVEFNANTPALMKNLFDYRSRDGGSGETANPYTFTPVSAPGNLLVTHDAAVEQHLTHLDVHLRVVEVVDSIRTRRLLNDVTKLNTHIVPQFTSADRDTLTEVLDVVGHLSQGVIDEISDRENSLNADVAFKIAPGGEPDPDAELDSYLRYGVYYFLRRPSRAKLYAQTSVLQNARLMVRMVDEAGSRSSSSHPQFAEFAETTYISMRVHRGKDEYVRHAGAPAKTVTLNSLYSRCPPTGTHITFKR